MYRSPCSKGCGSHTYYFVLYAVNDITLSSLPSTVTGQYLETYLGFSTAVLKKTSYPGIEVTRTLESSGGKCTTEPTVTASPTVTSTLTATAAPTVTSTMTATAAPTLISKTTVTAAPTVTTATSYLEVNSAGSTTLSSTFTCMGTGKSPQLKWTVTTQGSTKFAVAMSRDGNYNWVLYNIQLTKLVMIDGYYLLPSMDDVGAAAEGFSLASICKPNDSTDCKASYVAPCGCGKTDIYTIYVYGYLNEYSNALEPSSNTIIEWLKEQNGEIIGPLSVEVEISC